jgi:photosystem II stability/assembly factor-like uncharacterized protein
MRQIRVCIRHVAAALALFPIALCAQQARPVQITPQHTGVEVRLRGISAVDASVAWASGQRGTVLRTSDGGASWQDVSVAGALQLDFRDIEAFDRDHAVVLSIGEGGTSRVYRTANGGRNWILSLHNADPRGFFDCMVFEGRRGWLLGDPVDGKFQVYETTDAGAHWQLSTHGPAAQAGEAAFAASGTCIARRGGTLLVAGSGPALLHLRGADAGPWRSHDSGMGRGKPEAGVFSIAVLDDGALLVGGDYREEQSPGNAAHWHAGNDAVRTLPAPRGYRSGVACRVAREPRCVAVGPAGTDAWNGTDWVPITDVGYDAIDLAGSSGWASGADGRVGRVVLPD